MARGALTRLGALGLCVLAVCAQISLSNADQIQAMKESFEGMEFAMMHTGSLRPGLLLLSTDGTMNDHVVREAERFVGLGYNVAISSLFSSGFPDQASLSGTANSAHLAEQVNKAVSWAKTKQMFADGQVGLVGWGFGANAVLATAVHLPAMFNTSVAYTPDIAPTAVANFTAGPGKPGSLWISVDWEQFDHLHALEANMDAADVEWEISMSAGTKMHFMVDGHANYHMEAARVAMVRSLSFISDNFGITTNAMGTTEPERTIASLTEQHVNYTFQNETLAGLVVHDAAQATPQNKKPAVVIVPAWAGYDKYAVLRQNYFAQMGYVTMSANIYGLAIEETYADFGERIAAMAPYREANNSAKSLLFADKIMAAVDYVKTLPEVDAENVAVIGFCFGGTGVYNTFRNEKDIQASVSMHGNMMTTRDFTNVASADMKGKLLMVSGGVDDGEEGESLASHLNDLSKYGADWELMRFSGVDHGFSEWESGAYNPRAEGRGFAATTDVYAKSFNMTTAGVGTLPATARDLGNATAAYAWLADLTSVKETYDGMEFAMMYSDSEAKRPTLLLLSTDGTMNTHVVREAERFFMLGYNVATTTLFSSGFPDQASLSGTANSAHLAEQVNKAMSWVKSKMMFVEKQIGLVGWGFGANAVLATAAHLPALSNANVAYTPDITPTALASFTAGQEKPGSLWISVDWDQFEHLQALEANMDAAEIEWEISMSAGTKMHFMVDGHANYHMEAARVAMVRSLSFISDTFGITANAMGTEEPERTIASLTEQHVDYMFNGSALPGLVVHDAAQATPQNKKPAVVIVPAWAGYDRYAVLRQNYFAQMGYVTMSANIYGLDIEAIFPETDQRLAAMAPYREANNDEKSLLFADKIMAAVDYVKTLPEVDAENVAVIGFCFGGTGVYNTFRNEKDIQASVSMHGNMMTTRDFTNVASADMKGKLLMVSGGVDDGEEGESLASHLNDLSKYGADWELMRFSGVEHGFSEWESGAYNPRAEGRGFAATTDVYAKEFGMMTANIGFLPATAREFVNVTEAYGLGDLETVIETDDMMEFTMMYSESVAKRPTLLLLSMDGSNDAHVVREAQRFFTLGYNVATTTLFSSGFPDQASLSGSANSAHLAGQVNKAVSWVKSKMMFVDGQVGLVGWGFGANAVLATAVHHPDIFNAAVAYTPDIASTALANFTAGQTKPGSLWIGVDWDQFPHLHALEANMDAAEIEWEISMSAGTKMHFMVAGHANYHMEAARVAMVRSLSFISDTFGITANAMGTHEPNRTIASLTEQAVTYPFRDETVPGLVVHDAAQATPQNKKPAVVIVPAWAGYDEYAVLRQNYFAQMGYVTMSANIYGLAIEETYADFGERIAAMAPYREANNDEKSLLFADKIMAAVDYVKTLPEVDAENVAVIGFCFGGTGVYNTFRNEKDIQASVSMHGNMMTTRDFTNVASADMKGKLLMVSGGVDEGEEGESLASHLNDLSKYDADWELMRFSGVEHGFSEWESGAYNPRAEGRGFAATTDVYAKQFGMSTTAVGVLPDIAFDFTNGSAPSPAYVTSIVVASENHEMLETLVVNSGLLPVLQGSGQFTLFAPTDAAVNALPAALRTKLASGDAQWTPLLQEVLKYHVLEQTDAAVKAADLPLVATDFETLANDVLTIRSTGPQISAKAPGQGAATVTTADLMASNGVVHVINTVLLPAPATRTVVDLLGPDHTVLAGLLTSAGLLGTLGGEAAAFTVFAPTNAAFAKVDPAVMSCLAIPGNVGLLSQVLRYHVAGSVMLAADLPAGSTVPSIATTFADNNIVTADLNVSTADLLASNGVVHVLHNVLIPQGFVCRANVASTIADSPDHEVLETMVGAAGLVDTLTGAGLFTVFAPTDTAIDAVEDGLKAKLNSGDAQWTPLLQEVLKYHVLEKTDATIMSTGLPVTATDFETMANDGELTIRKAEPQISAKAPGEGAATVIAADLVSGNGIVHAVNTVLLPPAATRNIIQLGQGSADHSTLVQLLTSAGLVQTLSATAGTSGFTVFAPTDAAFAQVDTAVLACLQRPSNTDQLAELLKYHVAGSVITSGNLPVEIPSLATAYDDNNIASADLTVSEADLLTNNGVVHVVDSVLIPENFVCDDNECILETDNCNALATCENTRGSFTCTCPSDYFGDGTACSEITGPVAAVSYRLPMSREAFNFDLQLRFRRAIAGLARLDLIHVIITRIVVVTTTTTVSTGRRLLQDAIQVDMQMLAEEGTDEEDLRSRVSLENVNAEMAKDADLPDVEIAEELTYTSEPDGDSKKVRGPVIAGIVIAALFTVAAAAALCFWRARRKGLPEANTRDLDVAAEIDAEKGLETPPKQVWEAGYEPHPVSIEQPKAPEPVAQPVTFAPPPMIPQPLPFAPPMTYGMPWGTMGSGSMDSSMPPMMGSMPPMMGSSMPPMMGSMGMQQPY